MSVYTVLRDDVTNTRRTPVVWGVIGVFAALTALVFVAEIDIYDDAYRTLWDVSALVAFAFPLFVAPLTYLAVAGDRERGSIAFHLGLPNSRAEYFLAKYLSRAGVAVAAVLLATLAGFVVARVTFVNGADPLRFLTFGVVSALYALATAGVYVTLSAVTSTRSRAMFAVIAAYFLLGPFWQGLLPVVSLGTILDFLTSTLGVTPGDTTEEYVFVASPLVAYFQSTELVYTGVFDQYEAFSVFVSEPDSLPTNPWFAMAVMLAWATVVPALGYLRFRRSELG